MFAFSNPRDRLDRLIKAGVALYIKAVILDSYASIVMSASRTYGDKIKARFPDMEIRITAHFFNYAAFYCYFKCFPVFEKVADKACIAIKPITGFIGWSLIEAIKNPIAAAPIAVAINAIVTALNKGRIDPDSYAKVAIISLFGIVAGVGGKEIGDVDTTSADSLLVTEAPTLELLGDAGIVAQNSTLELSL